jgi:phenylpropionate dioxygenase-like ring-hydroxylating dioxygenase large terminal subunit
MHHPAVLELARRLVAGLKGPFPPPGDHGEVPVERYTSPAWLERERAAIFGRQPQIVSAGSELARPGACLAVEVGGVPLLVVRGADGTLRAFKNTCRHRSTQLVPAGSLCEKKAFVCPYHGWTYDLTGARIHAPHAQSFGEACAARGALAPAYAEERHGFVFASLAPFSAEAHLGPIDGDLAALGIAPWAVHRRVSRVVAGNWKHVVDAFLDGYHIRHLHRDTIYRFFLDARAEAERAGPHVRSVVARRALAEHRGELPTGSELRTLVTPSYLVFPASTLIVHPDYLSVLTCFPQAADRTQFVHLMVVPRVPETDAERAHWDKSLRLIDEGVFANEDLAAAEAMQAGMASGANAAQLFGSLEQAALWFHETVARAVE